ncbi:hypothetical protein D3C87_1938050 [compost metagenome]
MRTASGPLPYQLSARAHAQRAVEADDFAVQHPVFADMLDKGGKFLRLAEALREGNALAE